MAVEHFKSESWINSRFELLILNVERACIKLEFLRDCRGWKHC